MFGDRIQKFFDPKKITNKMSSSLLNVFNGSSKSEESNLKDTEVLVNDEGQHWFKRTHVGKFLGISYIATSTTNL